MTEQRQQPARRRVASRITALALRWRRRLDSAARLRAGRLRRLRRQPARPDPQTAALTAAPVPDPAATPAGSDLRPWPRIQAGLAARGPGRIPLPLTTLVLVLLVLLPALLLRRLPRPRAVGLEQLQRHVGLLQSFPPTPERPLPALWRKRLGARADLIWRHQRGPWWQLWSEHSDSPPLLVITAGALPGGAMAPLPPQALRVGDLVVIAPDPLSRLLLRDRLLPQQRLSHGLQRRCLERLRQDKAVLWNPTGLGSITGALAPLLQRYERGCLSLALGDGGLRWQGEAAERDSPWQGITPTPSTRAAITAPPPLPADQLLEIELGQADLLLEGLLSRPLIRDPLVNRYGLDAAALQLLRRTPLRLRLRRLSGGPFQAGLELQLPLGAERERWQMLLANLSRALLQQGLSPLAGPRPTSGPGERGASGQAGPAARSPAAPGSFARDPGGSATSAPATPGSAGPASRGPGGPAARGLTADAPVGAASLPPGGGSRAPQPPLAGAALPSTLPSREGASWSRGDGVVVGGWRWIGSGSGNRGELLFFLGPAPQGPLRPLPRGAAGLPGRDELRLRSRPRALASLGLLPGSPPQLLHRADQLWIRALPQGRAGQAGSLSSLSGGLRLAR
ncbi:MAG: hypothetical protein VKJ44_10085 [Synechococcus sp.]|nr:hypothetical protein [Synechococcus sp.]